MQPREQCLKAHAEEEQHEHQQRDQEDPVTAAQRKHVRPARCAQAATAERGGLGLSALQLPLFCVCLSASITARQLRAQAKDERARRFELELCGIEVALWYRSRRRRRCYRLALLAPSGARFWKWCYGCVTCYYQEQ